MLSSEELNQLKHQFIWFFNGENNVSRLFKNDIYLYLDVLYEKYKKELKTIIEVFQEGFDDPNYFQNIEIHNWFSNIKEKKPLSKEEFCFKIKEDENFGLIWGDLGVTDQLELRNWGINLGYDKDDSAFFRQKGFDQVLSLVESLKNNPETEEHIISFYNPVNKEFRLAPFHLYFLNFKCILISYEERVKWFIQNYYETGMEYKILLRDFKDQDLDNIKYYNETISIPKYRLSMDIAKSKMQNKKQIEFNYYFFLLFLKAIANHCNMLEGDIIFFNNKIPKKIIDQKIKIVVSNSNNLLKFYFEDILIEN